MSDQRIRELLAEADRHRAGAAEHMRRAAGAQTAYRAAKDQADAAWSDAITSYDNYLRRYMPDDWERQQLLADPAAEGERRAKRAITEALDALLGEDGTCPSCREDVHNQCSASVVTGDSLLCCCGQVIDRRPA